MENGENESILEVVEVQWNLVDNQYPQKSAVLCTFMPNKLYAYLPNIEPRNLLFLKTFKIEFDDIIITFTDQNRNKNRRQS